MKSISNIFSEYRKDADSEMPVHYRFESSPDITVGF